MQATQYLAGALLIRLFNRDFASTAFAAKLFGVVNPRTSQACE
jgi:hypothetical protein